MKASELKRVSISLEKVLNDIKVTNESNPDVYKHFIPHFVRVDANLLGELVDKGFKVYEGTWFANDHGLIIEW